MAQRAERGEGATRYPLRFGTAAFLLISVTLVLVLFVLPQRYVLSSGFRESGMSFPAPTTPFTPFTDVVVAARPLPVPPAVILPGPAEAFWAEVTPLLASGDYAAALPVFAGYLEIYPDDADARRELAITLLAAGRADEAVPVLRIALATSSEPDLRLLLARTLRDLGFTAEASSEYARLASQRPNDEGLLLEWARAHAWVADYDAAGAILVEALARFPASIPLRVELANVRYASGNVREAAALLAGLTEEERDAAGARPLWAAVLGSFFLRADVVPIPSRPTPLERATAERGAGNVSEARAILESSLAATPGERALWVAYANLLEYELADIEGARAALLEAERIGAYDPALQLRLARHDIWTGRNEEARRRLDTLLAALDRGAVGGAGVSRADVLALLGDLDRWEGDRMAAADRYRLALAAEPDHAPAREGMALLEEEVARQLEEIESPRIAGLAYSSADTDDFLRVDAAGQWADLTDDHWVWSGTAGQRWLGGYDLGGLDASRQGPFVDLELARWWRWGTVRTGLDFGAQRVRSGWDLVVGGSARHRAGGGASSELRFVHGPGYPLAGTLQSLFAEVVQDRLTLSHAHPLGGGWSAAVSIDAARLEAASDAIPAGSDATERLQLTVSAGRAVPGSLTLGASALAMTFTEPTPLTTTGAPLFWDPRAAFSVGPYARLDHALSSEWRLSGRINPGIALLDERRPGADGYEVVPHASLELGVRRDGRRISTALDLFYYQGQFDGYRTYGARLTVGARDLGVLGGPR